MPILNNLTLNDETQAAILKHLATTEALLARVASRLSGRERAARIWAMPDLGLPYNVARIMGGFYTGAYYEWETDVPFVPIDATVNSCGVAVFRLAREVESAAQFNQMIAAARLRAETHGPYLWNFDHGNHFITYGVVSGSTVVPDGPYLVLHASAAEYKKQHQGLYPAPNMWYSSAIAAENEADGGPRYLRYIAGNAAERFIRTAQGLDGYNQRRLRHFAEDISGPHGIDEETLNVSHYGMPTGNSVAIGCQWQRSLYLLLTAPGQPLHFVSPSGGGRNAVPEESGGFTLTPHGLGMESVVPIQISYYTKGISVNDLFFRPDESLKGISELAIRKLPSDTASATGISSFLRCCPGTVVGKLVPVYSYPCPCVSTSSA